MTAVPTRRKGERRERRGEGGRGIRVRERRAQKRVEEEIGTKERYKEKKQEGARGTGEISEVESF